MESGLENLGLASSQAFQPGISQGERPHSLSSLSLSSATVICSDASGPWERLDCAFRKVLTVSKDSLLEVDPIYRNRDRPILRYKSPARFYASLCRQFVTCYQRSFSTPELRDSEHFLEDPARGA
jgi:hypothetical protein